MTCHTSGATPFCVRCEPLATLKQTGCTVFFRNNVRCVPKHNSIYMKKHVVVHTCISSSHVVIDLWLKWKDRFTHRLIRGLPCWLRSIAWHGNSELVCPLLPVLVAAGWREDDLAVKISSIFTLTKTTAQSIFEQVSDDELVLPSGEAPHCGYENETLMQTWVGEWVCYVFRILKTTIFCPGQHNMILPPM